MATRDEVIKLMAVISLAYPSYEIKDGQPDLYHKMLADIDYSLLEAAAQQLIGTCKFFPSIAELRQAAMDIKVKAANIPSKFEAWQEVMTKIRTRWGYDEPEWSHPLIAEAVRVVGFRRLCMFDTSDEGYESTNFYKVYESLYSRLDQDLRMLPSVRETVNQLTDGVRQLAEGMRAK